MGIVVPMPHGHVLTPSTTGHKSGRNSLLETPVSLSIGNTNSAGTPRLDRVSQYQTCDCVVPMRSAKGFWPPAKSQARLSASMDMVASYPNLGLLQPKNLSETTYRNFGTKEGMKREIDTVAFGQRLKERREELGLSQPKLAEMAKLAEMRGYSQSNIGWLEQGKAKDPRTQAEDLAGLLRTTAKWLLWEECPKDVGVPIISIAEIADNYRLLDLKEREMVSETIAKCLAKPNKTRKRV